MDTQLLNVKYELPKSPALTPDGSEHSSFKDGVGRFLENPATNQSNFAETNMPNHNWQMSYQNSFLGQHSQHTVLATPPQSPLDMTMQHQHQQQQQMQMHSQVQQLRPQDMPLLTAMLANNSNSGNNNNQPFSHMPPTYIVNIPCFLCQEPFSTIESLRAHLTQHALQMQLFAALPPATAANAAGTTATIASPTSSTELNSRQPTLPAHWESPAAHATPSYPRQPTCNILTEFTCEWCGRKYPTDTQRNNCLAQHSPPKDRKKKPIARGFKCTMCNKSYKRPGNLIKHSRLMHSPPAPYATEALTTANEVVAPTSVQPVPTPPAVRTISKIPFPAPIQATTSIQTDCDTKKRCVWTTKMINAVAAANYSPAKESASKYMPPSEVVREGFESSLKSKPKQKYPLRSPYFNPNLWVNYDAYIE